MERNVRHMVAARDILEFYFRHQFRILLILFFTTFFVTALAYYFPEKYEVTAQLLVKIGREDASLSPTVTNPALVTPGRQTNEILNSEVAILESTYLVEELVSAVGPGFFEPPQSEARTAFEEAKAWLARKAKVVKRAILNVAYKLDVVREITEFEQAVLGFNKNLRVVTGEDSSVIHLIYRTPHPDIGQKAMSRYIQLYLHHRTRIHESKSAYVFFGEQVSMYESALEEAEAQLQSFQRENNLVSTGERGRLLLEQVISARTGQRQCGVTMRQLEARIDTLEAQLSDLEAPELVSKEVRRNPLLDYYRQQLADLTVRKTELEQKYLSDSPLVEAVDSSIAEIETLMAAAQKDVLQSTVTAPSKLAQTLDQQLAQCRVDLAAEKASFTEQAALLATLESELRQHIGDEVTLKDLARDVTVNEENYLLYRSKAEDARIQDALNQSRIASIRVAAPPTSSMVPLKKARFIPRKIYYVTIAVVFSLVVGVFYGLTLDYFDHTVHTKADVERHLEITVLGTFFRNEALRRVIRDVRSGR